MRFSICIPVYKTGCYLTKCIESIETQDFKDYEIIIVDDGSPDDSGDLADELKKEYDNISVIHQSNQGLFHARITAFSKAVGDYIISVDSDDWMENNSLQVLSDAIEQYTPDIVLYNNYICNESNKKAYFGYEDKTIVWEDKDQFLKSFFSNNGVNPIWRKAIKRSLLDIEAVKQYPRITMTEDWIHSFYPLQNASKIVYIPDLLYNYRYTNTGMTKVFDPMVFTSAKIVYGLKENYISHNITKISKAEIGCQFLVKVSKMLIYEPGVVKDKTIYYKFLDDIRKDEEVKSVFKKYNKKISLMYRLPLSLLQEDHYVTIYILKACVSKLRRVLKR